MSLNVGVFVVGVLLYLVGTWQWSRPLALATTGGVLMLLALWPYLGSRRRQ